MKIIWSLLIFLTATVAFAGQNVVVVMDDSGSMADKMRDSDIVKIEAAKQALIIVLSDLPPDSNVGILALNHGWVKPLGPITPDMESCIQSMSGGGGTPLGSSLKIGADALLNLRSKEHYGMYRLLVVTDGEAGDPSKVEDYLPDIIAKGLMVDVIGVDMAGEHSLATKVQSYRKANDPESLKTAIKQILAETANNAQDSSDYDIIAPIPDELADKTLQALSFENNSPIGETSNRVAAEQARIMGVEFIEPKTDAAPEEGNMPLFNNEISV